MSMKLKFLFDNLLFIALRGYPYNFKQKSKALPGQLSPSNNKVSVLHLSISYGVKSRLYLPANLLNQ